MNGVGVFALKRYAISVGVWLLVLVSFTLEAQTVSRSNLTELSNERAAYHQSQQEKAEAYARQNNIPLSFTDGRGNTIRLVGVDDFGLPIYRTTFNAGAAITTGAAELHPGGSLGLSLEGEGMVAGVWDDGRVKDHSEFGNRIVFNQGAALETHSTHVTGTILAAGLQSNAKGMAPKAQAIVNDYLNDDSEMAGLAEPGQDGLLISNHSYGVVLGYFFDGSDWSWVGNSAISTQEDFRFGFYSSQSRVLDQIAFNAPYYTIVWAAGNDRSDSGDGSRPPDGNQGTGYDCIGPEGVSKNIITVGAVNKVLNYLTPSSVVMSSFSSWGPTDDGRIKPDLVGAGVSIYSTSFTTSGSITTDSYAFQQGTSMAAPNVTGSLLLLQELHRDLNAGNFMRAATLKALAIHTAKEAGSNPGPDYSFGWGLLDVKAAAELLLAEDDQSVLVQENSLLNGQSFVYDFEPLPNTKVTATIVWTDPAGTPVASALDPTNTMLVNDLDLRIEDDGGNEVFPWILNPFNPSAAATRGDNFRDNVEKIEFDQPEPRLYRVVVTHKGTLSGGSQNFSLILTFTPNTDQKTAYYWIGNSGNWNDPAKWSLSSGGATANAVPDADSRVIIDENSFSIASPVITLTADASCASFTWLAKSAATLNLNNRKLTVDGNLVVSSNALSVGAGAIDLIGTSGSMFQFNTNGNNFSLVDVTINSTQGSSWTMNGTTSLKSMNLIQGGLVARNLTLNVGALNATTGASKSLDIRGTIIQGLTQASWNAASLTLTTNELSQLKLGTGTGSVSLANISFLGTIETNTSSATLSGGFSLGKLVARGPLALQGNNSFGELVTQPGAALSLQSGTTQALTSLTDFSTDAANRLSISSSGSATLSFSGHFKKCFDYLDVSNVSVVGDVTINVGTNSVLTNAANWISGACADALFADFSFAYSCKGAITEFTNLSDGDITTYAWNFGDPASGQNTSSLEDPVHQYNTLGTYTVTLTVSKGANEASYARQVTVVANDLAANKVIFANSKLFSETTAPFYQWYKDGSRLNGETGRSYDYQGATGSYFVVIKNSTCSMPSSSFVVTGLEESPSTVSDRLMVYPNPTEQYLTIEVPASALPVDFSFISTQGQVSLKGQLTEPITTLSVREVGAGLYILSLASDSVPLVQKKVVIR